MSCPGHRWKHVVGYSIIALWVGCLAEQQEDTVPVGEACEPVSAWDSAWTDVEDDVLRLLNQRRSEGADCGSEGTFPAVGPLAMDAQLRCAARLHSMDMSNRNFFDHTNPDGKLPWDRMEDAGYTWSAAGENIAVGQDSAESVMAGWMNSDGHCSNIMGGDFVHMGVGYYPTGGPYWTQVFGAPR